MSARFATTVAVGDPASLAGRCIAGLPVTDGATLGILYTTAPAAAVLPEIARALAEHTGIRSWVGGVGLGICSASDEIFDQPAAVVMTAALPPDGFRIFSATDDPGSICPTGSRLDETSQPRLGARPCRPRCTTAEGGNRSRHSDGRFVSGLYHIAVQPLLARTADEDGLGGNGVAGLMLAPGISVATGLTQGCMPIGPVHRIDEARDNVAVIDGALRGSHRDIGQGRQSLRRVGGLISAGCRSPVGYRRLSCATDGNRPPRDRAGGRSPRRYDPPAAATLRARAATWSVWLATRRSAQRTRESGDHILPRARGCAVSNP